MNAVTLYYIAHAGRFYSLDAYIRTVYARKVCKGVQQMLLSFVRFDLLNEAAVYLDRVKGHIFHKAHRRKTGAEIVESYPDTAGTQTDYDVRKQLKVEKAAALRYLKAELRGIEAGIYEGITHNRGEVRFFKLCIRKIDIYLKARHIFRKLLCGFECGYKDPLAKFRKQRVCLEKRYELIGKNIAVLGVFPAQ